MTQFDHSRSRFLAASFCAAALIATTALPIARAAGIVVFNPAVAYDTGEQLPSDLEPGDFNNDGRLDLAVETTAGGTRINFLIADGAGRLLKDNTLVVPHGAGMGSGDLNRDGLLDLVVTQSGNKTAVDGLCPDLRPGTLVFLGTGGETPGFAFTRCLVGVAVAQSLTDVVVADFNGDSLPDLAVGDDGFYGLRVYPGLGDGTFQPPVAATGSGGLRVLGPMSVADMNGDGHLDVLTRTSGIGTFFGTGSASLTFSSTAAGSSLLHQHLGVSSFAVGDFNRDGVLDIAGIERGTLATAPATPRNFLFVSLGTGNGLGFVSSDTYPFGEVKAGPVAAADFDRDGTLDVAAVHEDGNAVRLYLGNGDGTLGAEQIVPVGVQPQFIHVTDLNSDARPDLAVVDRDFGNQSRTWVLTQTAGAPDTIAPTVTIAAPIGGSRLDGQVMLEATADDNVAVSQVEFFGDGLSLGTDATAPFSIAWETASLVAGPHVVSAAATDAGGNTGTSDPVTVVVDRPPTADAGLPQTIEATSASGASVTLAGTGSDPDPGDVLSFVWTEGATVIGNTPAPTVTLPIGMHTLSLRVTDSFGAFAEDVVSVTVTAGDTSAPSVAITAPAHGSTVIGAVTVFATAADAVGVVRVEFFAGGLAIGPDTVAPYSASWSADGLASGTVVTLMARAYDAAGNTGSASVDVTVGAVSVTVPTIVSGPPAGVIPAATPYSFQFVAEGTGPLTWSLESAPQGAAINPSSGLMSWTPGATQLGRHSLTVRVTNPAGVARERYRITVSDTQPPSPPEGLTVVSVSRRNVTLAWQPAADDVGVAYYRVYEQVTKRGRQYWKEVEERVRGSSITLRGVEPKARHIYAVTAVDRSRNESALSAPVEVVR